MGWLVLPGASGSTRKALSRKKMTRGLTMSRSLGQNTERRMFQEEERARPEGAGPVRLDKDLNTCA